MSLDNFKINLINIVKKFKLKVFVFVFKVTLDFNK